MLPPPTFPYSLSTLPRSNNTSQWCCLLPQLFGIPPVREEILAQEEAADAMSKEEEEKENMEMDKLRKVTTVPSVESQ